MRYAHGIQFIFAICLITLISCQKEEIILEDNPATIASAGDELTKLDITEVLTEAEEEIVDTGDTNCHHKYEEAYAVALAEANKTCKLVTLYLDCIINGSMVSTYIKVFPSNDCMTPIDDGTRRE